MQINRYIIMTTKNLNLFNHLLIEELKRKDNEITSLKMQIENEKIMNGRRRSKNLNEIIKLKKSLSMKNNDFQNLLNEKLNK